MPLGRGWTKLWDCRPSAGPRLCLAEDEHQDYDDNAAADDEADNENEIDDEDEDEHTSSSHGEGSRIDTDAPLDPSHYPPPQAHQDEDEDEHGSEDSPLLPGKGSRTDTETLLDSSHYTPRQAHQDEDEDESEAEYSSSYNREGSRTDTDTLLDQSHCPPRQAHLIGPYSRQIKMAPAVVVPSPTGPPPSYINVSQVYLFQQQLQNQMIVTGTNPTREDNFRLQGVQWINEVRTALQL